MNRRPIGVFDSGIGGLTVVRELLHQLPRESLIYFGDTARVPYGNKSPATVRRYAREILDFLVARDVKMVVVACNTASAHALEELRRVAPVPVVGVIDPGAKAAVEASRTGRIGVIGTAGTIASGAYERAIHAHAGAVQVVAKPCPLFVPLVEEGWLDHPATRLIAESYLHGLGAHDIDALVLGCTHYPLLKPLLGEILGPGIALIACAEQTARAVAAELAHSTLHAPKTAEARVHFVVSDAPERFRKVGKRFLGERLGEIELHAFGEAEER